MRGSFHRVFVLFAVVGLALPALALDRECGTTENSAASETASTGVTATTEAAPASNKSCVSLPYTAHYKITRVVTQADGTILTQESSQVRAADSAGRWMTASTQPAREGQTPITQVTVADFVARTRSTWEVPGTVATVTAMRPKCAIPRPRPAKPPAEMLGAQTIDGIEAKGRRVTWNIPAGKGGHAEARVRTSETWVAADPGLWTLLVRAISHSPPSKITTELENVTRAEPDPALFRPPDGYQIVNRNAPPCPTE